MHLRISLIVEFYSALGYTYKWLIQILFYDLY